MPERENFNPKDNNEKIPKFTIGEKGEIRFNPVHPDYQREKEEREVVEARRAAELSEQLKRELEIPQDIKPGTGEMLFNTLRRQVKINEKALEGKEKDNYALLQATRKLDGLLEMYKKIKERIQEKVWDGKSTKEHLKQMLREMPAEEMLEYIDEYILELEQEEGYEHYIQVAKDLKMRLLDEANRLEK